MSLEFQNHPLLAKSKKVRSYAGDFILTNAVDTERKISRIEANLKNFNREELKILKDVLWLKSREAMLKYRDKKRYTKGQRLDMLRVSKRLSELANMIERRLLNES